MLYSLSRLGFIGRLTWLIPAMLLGSIFFSASVFASETATLEYTSHIHSWVGYASVLIFVLAYVLVTLEEKIHLSKSKPILLAAGLIWVLIAIFYQSIGQPDVVHHAITDSFLEYAELFFFLLVAMTYVNSMVERGLFDELRDWLIARNMSYRTLFWVTGILSFFISPIADNLTTALIMCAVVMAAGKDDPKFISLACINIVVAANAGGAFSPFGDITTLMVWQKGMLDFAEFFALFLPSLANFVVPAFIMSLAISTQVPSQESVDETREKQGGKAIFGLFLLTIITAVAFHNFLHIPPVFGMMMGLAYLKFYGYYLKLKSHTLTAPDFDNPGQHHPESNEFNVFSRIAEAEWDTLFFFYGVIMAVGGLGFLGYLTAISEAMYGQLGPTWSNVLVGILSAIVDNIPVMYAVLEMNPAMNDFQWLLITMTAGVGGSLLSIGSAAGVALMGQAKGHYTFLIHLKWTPVIALGYAASIGVHFLVN